MILIQPLIAIRLAHDNDSYLQMIIIYNVNQFSFPNNNDYHYHKRMITAIICKWELFASGVARPFQDDNDHDFDTYNSPIRGTISIINSQIELE